MVLALRTAGASVRRTNREYMTLYNFFRNTINLIRGGFIIPYILTLYREDWLTLQRDPHISCDDVRKVHAVSIALDLARPIRYRAYS